MKFRIKDEALRFSLIIVSVVLSLIALTNYHTVAKNVLDKSEIVINGKVKSRKIIKYVSNIPRGSLVDEVDINGEITAVLTKEKNKYESHIFNFETGKEVDINNLLKEEEKDNFYQKVNELLNLKYPKFIVDGLNNESVDKVFYLKENELIIYYYNYEIKPSPKEALYLKVNYNEIYKYLNITVKLDKDYQNEDGSIIDMNKKIIALTFDDGPGKYTARLVDILVDNKAKATFFMLGKNLNYYKDSVLKVFNNGMEIGYHSYAHTNFKRQKISEIKAEWNKSNDILKSITGLNFALVRPPYGAINSEVKELFATPFIFWHIDTEDWRHKDVEYLKNYVLENAHDGDIILFHDIHKTSVDTIEALLPELYVNGYQVLTVSELANAFGKELKVHESYRNFKR